MTRRRRHALVACGLTLALAVAGVAGLTLSGDSGTSTASSEGEMPTALGAHLAKLEIRVLFEELLAATDSIELAGEPARLRSSWINGLKRLPVQTVQSDQP